MIYGEGMLKYLRENAGFSGFFSTATKIVDALLWVAAIIGYATGIFQILYGAVLTGFSNATVAICLLFILNLNKKTTKLHKEMRDENKKVLQDMDEVLALLENEDITKTMVIKKKYPHINLH